MAPPSPRPIRLALTLPLLAALGCTGPAAVLLPPASDARRASAERDPWPPSGPVDGPQARALVARGALLVDVRSEEAFADEKLPGALSLPEEDIDQAKELFEPSRPLVLYCRAGIQSARVAKKLGAMGFTHVYDLGPMFGWRHGR